MKIFTANQIKSIDQFTILNEPISSISLMERASHGIAKKISEICYKESKFVVIAGTGNNGGDGLAVARILHNAEYSVRVVLVKLSEELSEDCKTNFQRLTTFKNIKKDVVKHVNELNFSPDEIIIDALFGSGISRKLENLALETVMKINNSGCRIISIDIPSGLFCEDNKSNNSEGIVTANDTITLQFPKLSFFFSENNVYTGNWHIVPIGLHPQIISKEFSPYSFQEQNDISEIIKVRERFSHKGNYGHALFISGSYGKIGAAVLGARGCIRSGVGLLTTYIPACGYNIMQITTPEAMVLTDSCDKFISELPDISSYNAIGIGSGIGTDILTGEMLVKLLETVKVPLIIDADGLNILALNKKWLKKIPLNTIITPHPKEFDRLAGDSKTGFERFQKASLFSKKHHIIVVLKGAYTQIHLPDGRVIFNSTGNPGMATGGSGDCLTGIILSLLAQGYRSEDAAKIGVFIHGLAGDIASMKIGEVSLMASDLVDNLPDAFMSLIDS